jgi:hypothetical protein
MAATTAALLTTLALVVQDGSTLRAAPSASAATLAPLPSGELLEVRGQRLDHVQVWNHRLERGGFVKASQLRPLGTAQADAPQHLAVLRFLRDTPGAEALAMAYVAAYLRAAPAAAIAAEPFDVLGTVAERLARRAGSTPAVSAQMEVAAGYGVRFTSFERHGVMQVCYDGEAYRRVLTLQPTPEEQARAVLALTRHECIDPALPAHVREANDRARAALLDRSDQSPQLDEATKNRLRSRRAGVWAAIAFGEARRGRPAAPAAQQAFTSLAAVNKAELGDEESADFQEAALRVGAVRGAAQPTPATGALRLGLQPGEPGQTCLTVQLASTQAVLAQRCTFALVWPGSVRSSADGSALAVAVQPQEGWTELWVWRSTPEGWALEVLPPAAGTPGLGYAEFAGWVPGATRKLLVAREARADGRATRRFEVMALHSFTLDKSASTPQLLAAFNKWADGAWRRESVIQR